MREWGVKQVAMSTFSPIGTLSSNGMRMCVCVCVCVDGMNLKYALRFHIHIIISSFRAMLVLYTSTRIHKPFADSEPTGLKVDIAETTRSKQHHYYAQRGSVFVERQQAG